MMLSGIWMHSIGISPLSSDKLLTYLILLLNFELKRREEKTSLVPPSSLLRQLLLLEKPDTLTALPQHSYSEDKLHCLRSYYVPDTV